MRRQFSLQVDKHVIKGDVMGDVGSCKVFCLHGAGQSNRNRYEKIRKRLLEEGVSSCAFDFPGHGETGGNLKESSLMERSKVTDKVIRRFNNGEPITVIGASMSGYTAVKLVELFQVELLVLIVPAAYDKEANALPFNAGFTECIRRRNSYLNSDAWRILKSYQGKLLVVSAENDQVIPRDVIELYKKSACKAKVEHMEIKNMPHKILSVITDQEIEKMVESVMRFDSK